MSPINSNSSSTSRNILVVVALALFVVALLLVLVTSFIPGSNRKLSLGGSYAEGYKAAREQAFQFGMPRTIAMATLSGTVVSVSQGSIKIKTNFFVDKRVDGIGPERTILVNGSTKILKRVEKDVEQYQKEQKEFMNGIKNVDPTKPGEALMPPQSFTTVETNISEIKAGDMLIVAVDGNDDLTLKDNIVAKTISVAPIAALVAPVPVK